MTDLPSAERPALGEILDLASVYGLAEGLAELHGIGFQLLDAEGRSLHETGSTRLLCKFLTELPRGAEACASKLALVRALKPDPLGGVVTEECFTGYRYVAEALAFEGGLLGVIVVGPYLPESEEPRPDLPASVAGLVPADGLVRARKLWSAPPAVGDGRARRVLAHAREALASLVHAGMARHYTAAMAGESLKEANRLLLERNRERTDMLERLKETDRLKANFLATMSHELRTPLTSVIGYSEMLLEGLAGELSPEQRAYVQTIMEKGDQLLGLISALIDAARAGSGIMRVRREPVDVGDLVASAFSVVKPMADRRRLRLVSEVPPGLPSALADREKLRQALLNLIGNAVKFTADGGTVAVAAAPARVSQPDPVARPFTDRNDGIRLSVRDSGVGIGPEHLEKIFQPFYQVDNSSTRGFPGAGIGLSLVRSFVQAMGGRVWAESEPGRGSTFYLTLPQAPVGGGT